MARTGAEPIGSMGTDTPVAVLSERPRLLYDYFQQLFAQVTNPPLDAMREELVTSLAATIGPEQNLLAARTGQLPPDRAAPPDHHQRGAGQAHLHQRGRRPAGVRGPSPSTDCSRSPVRPAARRALLAAALADVCARVSEAIVDGAKLIVLSDRHSSAELAPIPALLLVSAVHHHLIAEKTRTRVGPGRRDRARPGRSTTWPSSSATAPAAINPYLAFDTIEGLIDGGA